VGGVCLFVLCCCWHADTCGSWLCLSLAWDVSLNKKDYFMHLLPLVSWHCWPAAALDTGEKRRGNTGFEIKFDAGCGA